MLNVTTAPVATSTIKRAAFPLDVIIVCVGIFILVTDNVLETTLDNIAHETLGLGETIVPFNWILLIVSYAEMTAMNDDRYDEVCLE